MTEAIFDNGETMTRRDDAEIKAAITTHLSYLPADWTFDLLWFRDIVQIRTGKVLALPTVERLCEEMYSDGALTRIDGVSGVAYRRSIGGAN